MINLFGTSRSSLKKKYDKLVKEAYHLSKVDPEESLRIQKEAQKIQLELIKKPA